jgi:predicted unusual protein kinase regulating ubiquinone biosynthesis (AarF/ABC1/UbiB family)
MTVKVDYRMEAFNTQQFKAAMAFRGLNAVTAPEVVPELSTSKANRNVFFVEKL